MEQGRAEHQDREVLNDAYKPKPVRRVEIPKPDGGVRLLGIPTVLDRLIQQALLQALTPIFDPGFSEHSYGFRLRLADTKSVIEELDEWIRRRLRVRMLKQWKKPKTKYKNLVALGVHPEEARKLAGSRKGYWRLSDTPQVNQALGLAYWQSQGLLSLATTYRLLRVT